MEVTVMHWLIAFALLNGIVWMVWAGVIAK
jgi:hypothetical protein